MYKIENDRKLRISYNYGFVEAIKFEVSLMLNTAKKLVGLNAFPEIKLPILEENQDATLYLKLLANSKLCTTLSLALVDFERQGDIDPIGTLLNYTGPPTPWVFLNLGEYELGFWIVEEISKKD